MLYQAKDGFKLQNLKKIELYLIKILISIDWPEK